MTTYPGTAGRLMPELEIQDDYQAIVAGDFRLAFRWTGDRWVHELEHRGPRDPRLLARSFELAPEHEDPARVVSPTFQQLSFQEAGRGKMQALLVGQSGPHHFSAVFEVHLREQSRSAGSPYPGDPYAVYIKIEVADRCRAPVEGLASTYRVEVDPGHLSDEPPAEGYIEDFWDLGPNRLALIAPRPGQVAISEDLRAATRVQVVARVEPGRTTHVWTYYWRWDVDLSWI